MEESERGREGDGRRRGERGVIKLARSLGRSSGIWNRNGPRLSKTVFRSPGRKKAVFIGEFLEVEWKIHSVHRGVSQYSQFYKLTKLARNIVSHAVCTVGRRGNQIRLRRRFGNGDVRPHSFRGFRFHSTQIFVPLPPSANCPGSAGAIVAYNCNR